MTLERKMNKLPPSPRHGSNPKSSESACSLASWTRGVFVLSIGCCILALYKVNFVAIRSLDTACGYDREEFQISLPQKQDRVNGKELIPPRKTQKESRQQRQPSIAREKIKPSLHDRATDPVSKAWEVAMQQAEDMLAQTTTTTTKSLDESTMENTAACLVPDLRRTGELVRQLLSEQSKEKTIVGYQPVIPPRDNRAFEDPLVPLPILNVGMPKLGSTSLYHYFKCKGLNATHWNMGTEEFEGLCMRDAVRVGMPPLSTCANGTHAIMQMDVAFPMGSVHNAARVAIRSSAQRDDCFFPQLSILEEFHAESPNATLILTFRPMHDWTKSVTGWHSALERLQQCNLPNLPRGLPDLSAEPGRDEYNRRQNHTKELEAAMTQFFCSHVLHVRNFVKEHPTHKLIELDLYDEETPQILEQLFPSKSMIVVEETANDNAANDSPAPKSCWDKHTGGYNKKDLSAQRARKAEKMRKDAIRAGIEFSKSEKRERRR